MTDFRKHLRDKYLERSPDTTEWEDPDGDLVVLVAPSEKFIEHIFTLEQDDSVTQTESNARILVEVAYSPKTDGDGEPIRREGDLVPEDQIFETGDVDKLREISLGHPLGKLRSFAVDWFQTLRGDEEPDYKAFTQRVAAADELLDGADPEDYEKALTDMVESANKLVDGEAEGNS